MSKSTLQEQLKKSEPFDSLPQETYLNLLRTHNMVAAAPSQLLKQHGLSSAQYNVLRILEAAEPPGLPCLEIVSRMVTRVPDITRLIDRLKEAGLVSRTRSQTDRRVIRIKLTKKGEALIAELAAPLVDIHQQNLGHMTEAEMIELNRLLVKAREAAESGKVGQVST